MSALNPLFLEATQVTGYPVDQLPTPDARAAHKLF